MNALRSVLQKLPYTNKTFAPQLQNRPLAPLPAFEGAVLELGTFGSFGVRLPIWLIRVVVIGSAMIPALAGALRDASAGLLFDMN